MKKVVFAVLCITQLFFINTAFANPIHVFPLWENSDKESVSNELIFIDGDLTLTITAWTTSYNTEHSQLEDWQKITGDNVGVFRDENGLGVVSSDRDGNDLDGGSSSNYAADPDEGLLFVFSHYVELLDVFVGDLDGNDDINFSEVMVNDPNNITLGKTVFDEFGAPFQSEWPFEFDANFNGRAFMLWVDGSSDDVEVLGIAVVPEPTPILLFALGLLGMGLRKRK